MAEQNRWPDVREITLDDLNDAIGAGIADFRAAPGYGLMFSAMYALGGWILVALVWWLDAPYLAYPLAMGFALIGPFAAVGYYAISELLERGETVSWPGVFGGVKRAGRGDLKWMALAVGFALLLWLVIAAVLTFGFGGINSFEPHAIDELFTTPSGLAFLALGNLAGALVAFAVFSISVVSFPMLYDRDVDFVTAMVTSVRLVLANPRTMVFWCMFIGMAVGLSILSAFLGLLIFLPIIGHATWHLYRKALDPSAIHPTGEAVAI